MIAFDGESVRIGAAVNRIHNELRLRRLIPMPASSIGITVSPLTSAFLQDLSEVALSRFGEDPLSAYDTPVALLSGHPFACEVDVVDDIIFVSDSFLAALEFAAAQASLVNIVGRIRRYLIELGKDQDKLLEGIKASAGALHPMYMTRMLLHIIGEKPAPAIAKVLPKEHKLFVHSQLVTATTFALLHEQAHIEIKTGRLVSELTIDLGEAFVSKDHTDCQIEEYTSDLWAAQRIVGERRGSFVRAASFFFFNQWVVDYILHNEKSEHPPAFNRIQHLMLAVPEMRQEDINFYTIMTSGLNSQYQLRRALNELDQSKRYASLLRYSRAGGSYEHYEEIADALSRSFEELGLEKKLE